MKENKFRKLAVRYDTVVTSRQSPIIEKRIVWEYNFFGIKFHSKPIPSGNEDFCWTNTTLSLERLRSNGCKERQIGYTK